jgi:hypothetical protein
MSSGKKIDLNQLAPRVEIKIRVALDWTLDPCFSCSRPQELRRLLQPGADASIVGQACAGLSACAASEQGLELSQRSREAFSGMRHTATDSAEPALVFRMIKATRLSVANYNTTLSSDSLETGTGSSNSLPSTIQSAFPLWRNAREEANAWYWHSAQPRAC